MKIVFTVRDSDKEDALSMVMEINTDRGGTVYNTVEDTCSALSVWVTKAEVIEDES